MLGDITIKPANEKSATIYNEKKEFDKIKLENSEKINLYTKTEIKIGNLHFKNGVEFKGVLKSGPQDKSSTNCVVANNDSPLSYDDFKKFTNLILPETQIELTANGHTDFGNTIFDQGLQTSSIELIGDNSLAE